MNKLTQLQTVAYNHKYALTAVDCSIRSYKFSHIYRLFGSLFTVEIDVKDDFFLKNEVLLSKNVIFV